MAITPSTHQTDRSELEPIRQIILALDRAVRSQRLYAPNNPVLIRHHQDLLQQFTNYLSNNENLSLLVSPFDFKANGESVYHNEDEQESFAFKMFNDGVRSLLFKEGLTQEEILDFIKALNTDPGAASPNADAVTEFWERDFQHIFYAVANTIIDEQSDNEPSMDEKIEGLCDPKMQKYSGPTNESDDEAYEDLPYKDMKVTLSSLSVGKLFQERSVLSAEDLDKIQKDIAESNRPERLVLDFVDMVLAVLQEEEVADDYYGLVEVVGNVLDNNLVHGQMHTARMLMEQVHTFPSRPIKLTQQDANLLPKTLKILWPPTRIDLLIQAINQTPEGTPEDIERLIQLVDPGVMPHLLKLISTIQDPHRRALVCKGIAKLHRGDLGIFQPLIRSKDPEIVKTGLQIVVHIKSDKVIDLIPHLLRQPDRTIRREAIAVLRNFRGSKAVKILTDLLTDPSEEIRVLALQVLSMAAGPNKDVARNLMVTINRPEEFLEKSLKERKSYFHAVAKLAGDDFVAYLQDVLTPKGFFRKDGNEDQVQLAAYALTVIGSPTAKKMLETSSKSKDKTVRRWSESALRLMTGTQAAEK